MRLNDSKRAPKKFWSYVKSRTKTHSKIPILGGKDESKTETLNNSFSRVFTDEHIESLPEESSEFLGYYLSQFIIMQEIVEEKLEKLNLGKTPGPDKWHPILLKSIADLIPLPQCILFQKGILPNKWLSAIITAIHKNGNPQGNDNQLPPS